MEEIILNEGLTKNRVITQAFPLKKFITIFTSTHYTTASDDGLIGDLILQKYFDCCFIVN